MGGEDIGTVQITVNPVNDPPVAANDFFFAQMNEILEVDPLRNLLLNDFDVDGDNLTITSLPPDEGLVTVNQDGTFSYEPAEDYVGPDSFEYKISDGFSESIASVNLQVQIPRAQDSILRPFLEGFTPLATFGLGVATAIAFPGSALGIMMTAVNVAVGIVASTAVPLMILADFLARRNQILNAYQIDETGNFVSTPLNIEYNADNLPSSVGRPVNQPIAPEPSPALAAPNLDKVELTFDPSVLSQYGPVVYVEGSNILANTNVSPLGSQFSDLKIEIADGKVENGIPQTQDNVAVIPSLSQQLPNNRQRVAISIPKDVSIGDASIKVIRPIEVLDLANNSNETIEIDSSPIQFPRTELDYEFTVARDNSDVIVTSSDNGATVARINLPDNSSPISAAINPDSTRYYVPLRNEAEVAVLSTLTLNPIDFDPTTDEVDSIKLPTGAVPEQIAINPSGQYAYISDRDNTSVYILDITPGSADYHQVVGQIVVGGPSGSRLRKLAISSDGKVLFATQSSNFINTPQSRVLAININPADKGTTDFHRVITTLDVPERVFGISSIPDTDQMAVTFRRTFESQGGFALLDYQYNVPEDPASGIQLSLGNVESVAMGSNLVGAWDPSDIVIDTFEFSDPSSPTGTSEKSLAFVGGFNGGPIPSIALNGPRELNDVTSAAVLVMTLDEDANGNYSFKDKLSFLTPKLVGHITDLQVVTREVENPITLEKERQKEIVITYPGKGTVVTYDPGEIALVAEIAESDPDLRDRLKETPIDLEVPDVRKLTRKIQDFIDAASGLETVVDETLEIAKEYWERGAKERAEEALQEIEDKVPGRPWDIVLPSPSPIKPIPSFVDLVPETELSPVPSNLTNLRNTLQPQPTVSHPTFEQSSELSFLDWTYREPQTEDEEVKEIALFISTSPDGEGLEPGDWEFIDWQNIINNPTPIINIEREILGQTVIDFNPNRVLTATGVLNPNNSITWSSLSQGGQEFAPFTIDGRDDVFPIGDYLDLTPGRYHYKLWTKQKNGNLIKHDPSSFNWYPTVEQQTPSQNQNNSLAPFPSVTLITPDAFKNDENSFDRAHHLSLNIADKVDRSILGDGNVLRYEPLTGNWISIYGPTPNSFDTTRPLVLITDWTEDSKDNLYNSGTAEAVADSVFASLLEFDDDYFGGEFSNSGNIYDDRGNLIYTPGSLLNSPFHFISFGAGAVVNTEIIQRIGTAFPKTETQFANTFPDLQMTTIDPSQGDDFEPKIAIWDNVTFADNYYQSATQPFSNELNDPEYGRAEIDLPLGGQGITDSRAGFTGSATENGNIGKDSNTRAVAWYEGTVDLNSHQLGLENDYPVHRRLGDFSQPEFSNTTYPWYVSDHPTGGEIVINEFKEKQWEGNGTGWFYSILGNGYFKRPSTAVDKRPVWKDNTEEARQRGDFAVPTLFNGNFDAIHQKFGTQPIPGWSFHNNILDTLQTGLKDWKDIPSLTQPNFNFTIDHIKDTNGNKLDSFGNLVEELNVKSLLDALLIVGYTDNTNNDLFYPNGNLVTELEFNLLLTDLQTIGYTISPVQQILLATNGLPAVGIDIDSLALELASLGYQKSNGNLVKNGNTVINNNVLKTLKNEASAIKGSYLEVLGIDKDAPDYESNYALGLSSGDRIAHNRFVVPDWGVLRFDLHVPNSSTGTFKVYLDDQEFTYSNDEELLSSAFQGLKNSERNSSNGNLSSYPAVHLLEFDPNTNPGLNGKVGEAQSNRISFAKDGFQTFQVDIPNQLRGKTVTLGFEVNGDTVYLDNVFFGSQHLQFGNPQMLTSFIDPNNPGEYLRQEARKDIDTPEPGDNYFISETQEPFSNFSANYLIERPQYSLSYNDFTRTPNWVAYQLNRAWLGNENKRPPTFQPDPRLPFATNKGPVNGDIQLAIDNYDRGHLAGAADRSRNKQDYNATFLMTNVLPQIPSQNYPNGSQWTELELYLRDKLVDLHNKELYIIAGRDGYATDSSGNSLVLNNKVSVPQAIWKVVLVLDSPGQGINDVTDNTLAFGIYLPNTLDANDKGQDPNKDWTGNFRIDGANVPSITLDGKTFGLFNIDQLETITGYNFLANIPTEIQDVIESKSVGTIRTKINIIEPAPLLATSEELFPHTLRTVNNRTVGHRSFPNYITMPQNRFSSFSSLEISESQNSIFKRAENSIDKISTTGIHLIHSGTSEIGAMTTSPIQISGEQISISENNISHASTNQTSSKQIGSSQVSSIEVDVFEISSSQFDPSQISTFNPLNRTSNSISFWNTNQFNSIEIALPSIVSSQQFVSSDFPNHNSTPQIINKLNHTATNIWSNLLQPPIQLDINFQITDLPTGQLAEATITGFDENGTPNAGTIVIDRDANGIGWFIDPTPLDNSEFIAQNTDTYFLAAAESEAHGKYDLLTTVLHELAHLYGFIDGYVGFDALIDSERMNNNFTISPDGEHLDREAHEPIPLI